MLLNDLCEPLGWYKLYITTITKYIPRLVLVHLFLIYLFIYLGLNFGLSLTTIIMLYIWILLFINAHIVWRFACKNMLTSYIISINNSPRALVQFISFILYLFVRIISSLLNVYWSIMNLISISYNYSMFFTNGWIEKVL